MSTSMPSAPGAPGAPGERRIIPLRPAMTLDAGAGADGAHGATVGEPDEPPRPRDVREDAVRHYLKFMLPSIPVAAFILTFVLCDIILGVQTAALASAAHILVPPEDPSLPLAAAIVVSATTGALCMWIYFGYLRLTQRDTGSRA